MKIRTVVVFILAGWLFAPQSVSGQDFNQLLDAVNKLELSLKQMVQDQAQLRDAQIATLEKKLDALRKSQAQQGANANISNDDLKSLLGLHDEMQGLSAIMEMKKSDEMLLADLKKEVADAAAQIRDFQKEFSTIENSATDNTDSNESTKPLSTFQVATVDRIQSLSNSIANIETRLSDLKDQDKVFSTSLKNNLEISGFVDASAVSDFEPGETGFHLDQVEIDISKGLSKGVTLRADIEAVENGSGEFGLDLEQAYMTYQFSSDNSWTFTFGKFNAPIGFELLDAPDMYQFSHALVFDLGLPTNTTGFMINKRFSSVADITTYAVNGWDVNADNNTGKTFGMRLGIAPTEQFGFGVSVISGPEQDDSNKSRRNVFDIDMTANPSKNWLIGAEVNYGRETHALPGGAYGEWFGVTLMSNVALGERFGLTERLDYFKDTNGLRTGVGQKLYSVTISPSVSIAEGLGGLFEIRYNEYSAFDVNTESTNQIVTAFEFTHTF